MSRWWHPSLIGSRESRIVDPDFVEKPGGQAFSGIGSRMTASPALRMETFGSLNRNWSGNLITCTPCTSNTSTVLMATSPSRLSGELVTNNSNTTVRRANKEPNRASCAVTGKKPPSSKFSPASGQASQCLLPVRTSADNRSRSGCARSSIAGGGTSHSRASVPLPVNSVAPSGQTFMLQRHGIRAATDPRPLDFNVSLSTDVFPLKVTRSCSAKVRKPRGQFCSNCWRSVRSATCWRNAVSGS